MAYRDDVSALSPDHTWRFDGDVNDSEGLANGTNVGCSLTASPITEDATNSAQSNGTADSVDLPSTGTINNNAMTRKAVGGWLEVSAIQLPPKSVYREGTTSNQFNLVLWAGNNLMLDIVDGSTVFQAFSDQVLQPNRAYHILAKVEGTGFGDLVELYVDGVLQGSSTALGLVSLASRGTGAPAFSSPVGTTEVGNATVLLNGLVNGNFAYWATWADKALTPTQIREELFEKGALPGTTISADTQVNMQTALDLLADTVRPDEPLNIRIEEVTGGGDLALSADNITHDPLASIHVQYMGTGTLTWTNTNGSNASIGSTPNGGTINFVTPAVLTVSPLIAGSEVRILESGTITEIAGVENSGTSFQTSVSVNTVDVIVASLDYQFIRVNNVDMTGGDLTVPISQVLDRQYLNP